MMIPNLSEATIRRHAIAQSFERGLEYYESGSVVSLVQRGKELTGLVEGSDVYPYRVSVGFDPGGITRAGCTCPYAFEGWCKHIVAVLLTCVHDPDQIEQRAELAALLVPLNRHQLKTILQNLVEARPEWIDAIEQEIACLPESTLQPQTPAKAQARSSPPRRTSVDPAPIERQVQNILYSYQGQWNDDPAIDEVRQIVYKADKFLEQGDGNNALIILGAVTRAYSRDWMNLDGSSGESGMFLEELDDALTEALLSAELSEGDRQRWWQDLENWQAESADYGVDTFCMSLTALEQGWDYPPLQRVLQGESGLSAWEEEAPDYANDLARIRLRILERQGRYEEYLHLAEAEGQTDCYLRMLAKLGRTEDAIAQAQRQMSTVNEAMTLAYTLRERGELEQALLIATQGLSLDGYGKHQLAEWASELAAGMDQPDVALNARIAAFKDYPSLADYQKVQELAGDQWETLKPDLLNVLRDPAQYGGESAKVEILLAEGLLDEAIATVDQLHSFQSDAIQAVMDAAIPHRSDWVIANARRRAESIMDSGKAKHYFRAIEWLRRVRAAYLQLEQPQVWQQYHADLMQTHSRKRKLTAMLRDQALA